MWLDLYLLGAIASGFSVLCDTEELEKEVNQPAAGPLYERPFLTAMLLMWLWPLITVIALLKILTEDEPSNRR